MLKKILFFASVLLISANAHQVITKELGGNKFEIAFWTHDGFGKYEPSQILGANGYDENLQPIKTGIEYNYGTDKIPEILTQKTPALMVAMFDAKYWVGTDKGYITGNKVEYKGIVFDSLKSIKLGKTYYKWSENLLKPVGLKLEVIALNNPFKLKIGDMLPVLVLKDGKPFAGATFETAKEDLDVVSNEFGIALIPIKEKGLNIIAAGTENEIFDDPKASKMLIQSSISFELK